ncbi:MAG: hypothetical protein HY856_13665 [Burkholderiales bacterium]|nr:hypothetical protein [Burkholderiales bacterium]
MAAPEFTTAETAGGILGAIVVGVMGWRRMLRTWSADRAATIKTDAEANVVELLRAEVQRLSEQNSKLAAFANELQTEMLELRKSNVELQQTVTKLHAELRQLKGVA